jgi:hypothetical protein
LSLLLCGERKRYGPSFIVAGISEDQVVAPSVLPEMYGTDEQGQSNPGLVAVERAHLPMPEMPPYCAVGEAGRMKQGSRIVTLQIRRALAKLRDRGNASTAIAQAMMSGVI